MHISRGLPFTSAPHEPHFAALQFQRTARSGACVRWISCTASRTTVPSPRLGLVRDELAARRVAAPELELRVLILRSRSRRSLGERRLRASSDASTTGASSIAIVAVALR